jgi:CheY-like chemotaxis protein
MTRISDASRDMRLLLVEDNHGDILLFRRTIARLGLAIDLEVVPSGEVALQRLRGDDLPSLPDLIVTDLNLPGMSGFEFLETVKSDPGLRRIPVLVVSSSTDEGDIAGAYDRQAGGYFAKPIDTDEYANMLVAIESYWRNLMQLPSPSPPVSRADR